MALSQEQLFAGFLTLSLGDEYYLHFRWKVMHSLKERRMAGKFQERLYGVEDEMRDGAKLQGEQIFIYYLI
jgi:hypothetical protein